MVDAFYTPPALAARMIAAVPKGRILTSIADFAAGEGILLSTALQMWPDVDVVANDISKRTARTLSSKFPSWSVSCSDFLLETSVSHSKYHAKKAKIDLILINPPFSQRGKKPVHTGGPAGFHSGVALAFLFRALEYLSKDGLLIAILPNSCFESDRDRAAWAAIHERFTVELIRTNERSLFKSVVASTSIVRLCPRKRPVQSPLLRQIVCVENNLSVQRGRLQMHSLTPSNDAGSLPLVHTSNLRQGKVEFDCTNLYLAQRVFWGPGVLFPRVGRITTGKICVLGEGEKVVLSDCVLGIFCPSLAVAEEIREALNSQFSSFARGYNGTGAPYITVERAASIVVQCLRAQHPTRAIQLIAELKAHMLGCKREYSGDQINLNRVECSEPTGGIARGSAK